MSIGYSNIRVSEEKLLLLKRELDDAPNENKYYKFRTWLHHANLDNWQRQGHHFQFLTQAGGEEEKLICTCGLFVEGQLKAGEEIHSGLAAQLSTYSLDQVQIAKGHRSLDDFKSETVALIFSYLYEPELDRYLWSAYCQVCGEVLIERKNDEAKKFVRDHNSACGRGGNLT
jgi:hypothetical protein